MSQRQTSPAPGAASLRPRARRLISIEDDSETLLSGASTTSSAVRSNLDSVFSAPRRSSPAPAAHPSRGTSATRPSAQHNSRTASGNYRLEIPNGKVHNKSSSLWASSWSSIQGVASTLLGSNIEPTAPLTPGGGKLEGRKKDKHARNYSLAVPDEPWGPSGNGMDLLAAGSQEDRLAKVQAEKRKRLLAGVGDEQKDTLGHYKRRTSLDRMETIPSPTLDDDALVYIHKVTSSDSVAGLSIKYNCAQAVVRKSNRLYPNDTIQLRKIAYLPVDACSIRGRKVSTPRQSNVDLLSTIDASGITASIKPNGGHNADYHIAVSPATPFANFPESLEPGSSSTDQPWTHDSWVILPNSSTPTEIGRMTRRTLGFFPPARRKSINVMQAYTDESPPRPNNIDQSDSLTPQHALTASAHTSPGRGASPSRVPIGRLSRSSSSASKLNPHSRFAANFLRGPGGVGSLHSSVHGPAPDELNRFVAMHMPRLMIEAAEAGNTGPGNRPSVGRARSTSTGKGLTLGGPRLSFDRVSVASGGSAGTGVEAVAGAVEGWMRKVGGKVKESLGTPELRGRGKEGGGDLIELMEAWDLNGDASASSTGTGLGDSWESEGHGVIDDAITASPSGRVKGKGKASAREDEERLLRERFPPAGRVFEEQSKKGT